MKSINSNSANLKDMNSIFGSRCFQCMNEAGFMMLNAEYQISNPLRC